MVAPESLPNPVHPGPTELRPLRENEVVAPSDMIALGDAQLLALPGDMFPLIAYDWLAGPSQPRFGIPLVLGVSIAPFALTRDDTNTAPYILARHGGRWNVVFCDSHVESLTTKALFDPRQDAVLRRWNRDHQPHREDVARVYAW